MIPISALGCFVGGSIILGLATLSGVKKRPRRATSLLAALAAPFLLSNQIQWAADCVHLGLMVGFEATPAGVAPKPDRSRFAAYDWSTGLAGGPSTFLIYDESDEIAQPLALHKHSPESENGFGESCAGRVRRLLGHYYVCTF
jgi:hypothetical protein